MIEQIYTYFTIETLYMWINLGVLPFWFILIVFPQSHLSRIFVTSIFPFFILSGVYIFILYKSYLIGKGINETFINDTVDKIKEDNSDQDFFSAIKLCKKKRIGPARTEDNRTLFYKKDISLLARNGFDFETSKKVMDIEKDEYLKIINLLSLIHI